MSAMYLMDKGVRYQVGNGNNIKMWEHNWLTELPLKPLSRRPSQSNLNLVRDLMTEDGRQWDQTVVRQLFFPQKTEIILRIPISQTGGKDRLVWHFSASGVYTVKSGYQVAIRIQQEKRDRAWHSERDREEARRWTTIWKLRVKGKIKMFIWKCNHKALPIRAELKRRKMQVDPICLFCGEYEETIEHLVFQCHGAKRI